MQATHFRHQLDLRRCKIILLGALFLALSFQAFSQARFNPINSSGQDDKLVSYGFFLSGHRSSFRVRYSDAFMMTPNPAQPITTGTNTPAQTVNEPARAQLHSLVPLQTVGFSLGFLGILRLDDQVNLLFTPAVGFYEHELMRYTFTDNPIGGAETLPLTQTPVSFDATMVELPLLLKYKSQRFNNTRMYFIGGLNYMFRTKSQDEANLEDLVLSGQDLSLELGMGFDIYFRFFKWSPEIRFSHGLLDVYQAGADLNNTNYGDAIQSVRRRNIRLIFNFQ